MGDQTRTYLFGIMDKAGKAEATGKPISMRAIEAAGREAYAACRSPQAVKRLSEEIERRYFDHLPADEDSGAAILRRLAGEREAVIRKESDEYFKGSSEAVAGSERNQILEEKTGELLAIVEKVGKSEERKTTLGDAEHRVEIRTTMRPIVAAAREAFAACTTVEEVEGLLGKMAQIEETESLLGLHDLVRESAEERVGRLVFKNGEQWTNQDVRDYLLQREDETRAERDNTSR